MKYLNTAINLLPIQAWDSHYDRALTLYEDAAEMSYLNGDFEQMQQRIDQVLQHANTVLDKIKVYETQIAAALLQKQALQALEIALAVLEQLGVYFPKQPSQEDVRQALQTTSLNLTQYSIADIIDLPIINDATASAIIRLIVKSVPAAYTAKPEAVPLLICTGIDLSLKGGNNSLSTSLYAMYAFVLCGMIKDIETGDRVGELSLNLLAKIPSREI